jgi:hypothetical protein
VTLKEMAVELAFHELAVLRFRTIVKHPHLEEACRECSVYWLAEIKSGLTSSKNSRISCDPISV